MIKATALLVAALQLSGEKDEATATAPAPGPSVSAVNLYDGSANQLDIPVSMVTEPDIDVDGDLRDGAWRGAAVLTGFTQYDPIEGSPASERTEIRMLMSDEALYFAIRSDDSSDGVRATLSERDGFRRSDDYVQIVLDTFDDQRRAYVFMVNPLGVQGDGLWVEGGGRGFGDPIDWAPDFLWESAGRVDAVGYSVELRIPLKSLRFPAKGVQDWGLQVQRSIRRTGYAQSWAPLTSERANRLAQSGRITGLENLDPGMFLEVNPTIVASRAGTLDPESARLTHASPEGELGLNMTYGITSNLTLDGTLNPDFSQVEADAGQIVVNERFALFLPEQRPFFLEGAEVFTMPQRLVYTRSIVNPVGAAKISGKVGGVSVAYLGALDDVGNGASKPVVNLVRFKGDVGNSSSLGMVYTDRTDPGADFNRVLGADGRFVLGGRYTLAVMAAGSADGSAGSSTEWGSLLSASLDRSGRDLSVEASFEDIHDDFRAGSGFIRRTGITRMEGEAGYSFRGGRDDLVESWGPSLEVEGIWDRSDFWAGRGPQESEIGLGLRTFLKGNVGIFLNYRRNSFDFDGGAYASFHQGLAAPVSYGQGLHGGLHSVSLRSWIGRWERVRLSWGGGWRETPLFASGVPVDVGRSWNGEIGVTLYPTGSLEAELGARHVSIFRKRDGSRYSTATIPRLQARYQISRALFVRGIGEYSSQERGPLLDPVTGQVVSRCSDGSCSPLLGSDSHDFRLEALLAYESSPGSVFFLGYSRHFEDTSAFGFRQVAPVADGLFLKLSYRFRM